MGGLAPGMIQYLRLLRSKQDQNTDPSEVEHEYTPNVDAPSEDQSNTSGDPFGGLRPTPGPAFSKYAQHLESMPDRKNYEPGFGRKLYAGLVGAAATFGSRDIRQGNAMVKDITEGPYNEAMHDYMMKGQNLGNAARLEEMRSNDFARYMNIASQIAERHERTSAYKGGKEAQAKHWENLDRTEQDKYGSKQKYDEAMLKIQQQKADAATTTANAARTNAATRSENVGKSQRVPPRQDVEAEVAAVRKVLSADPAYADFADPTTFAIKPFTKGGWLDGGMDQQKYNEFVRKVNETKKRILGTSFNPSSGNINVNMPNDDEDEGDIVEQP